MRSRHSAVPLKIAPPIKVSQGTLKVEGSGRVVNAKTVEQVGACDHQIGPHYRGGPVKRRLPRAPKELSDIESGGGTRPTSAFL